jgi:hypothetical protein
MVLKIEYFGFTEYPHAVRFGVEMRSDLFTKRGEGTKDVKWLCIEMCLYVCACRCYQAQKYVCLYVRMCVCVCMYACEFVCVCADV